MVIAGSICVCAGGIIEFLTAHSTFDHLNSQVRRALEGTATTKFYYLCAALCYVNLHLLPFLFGKTFAVNGSLSCNYVKEFYAVNSGR